MNKDLSVDINELNNIINSLEQQYNYLSELYKNIDVYLNDLKESSMIGDTAKMIMEVCTDWEDINKNRLIEYQVIINSLKESYNSYKSLYEEVKRTVS